MPNTVTSLSTEQLLQVLSLSDVATAVYTTEHFRVDYANEAMANLLGAEKELTGKLLGEAIPAESAKWFLQGLKEAWQSRTTCELKEIEMPYPAGASSYFDFKFKPIQDESGNTICILHTAKNVTENYYYKQDIRQRETREESLTTKIDYINGELQATTEKLSFSNEQFASINEELTVINEELITSNEELVETQHLLRASLEEVKQSENRFQSLVCDATIGIIVLAGPEMEVLIVNNAYGKLIGRAAEELYGKQLFQVIPEAEPAFRPIIDGVRNSGEALYLFEHPYFVYQDDEKIEGYLNLVYQPYRESLNEITGVMVLCQDVTEQVNARKKLIQAEERVRLAVAAGNLGTYDYSYKESRIITSPRFDEIFGITSREEHEDYLRLVHPEDLEIRNKAHQEAAISGKLHYTIRILRKSEIRWIRAEGTVYFDEQGKPERLLGIMQDITEQKALQQQKDDFISIASHELKTPITTLKASLQLIDKLKNSPSNPMLPKLLEQAKKSVNRVSVLIEDLLNVGRLRETEVHLHKTRFNLWQLISSCVQPFELGTKHRVEINGSVQLEVNADEHRIEQVITNLLSNAVKYAPHSELIQVSVDHEANFARISVTDFGPGIPQDKLPRLFERYYRAEPLGHPVSGLGLGLYICAEIIRKHQGQLTVESHPGKGSTFSFTLPLN